MFRPLMGLLLIDLRSVKWSPSSRVLVPLSTWRYLTKYLQDMVSLCMCVCVSGWVGGCVYGVFQLHVLENLKLTCESGPPT